VDFDLWFRVGSRPYERSTLEFLFQFYSLERVPLILVESKAEADFLEGMSLLYGRELEIREVTEQASTNPWVYNRNGLFLTWDPLRRINI
jgi:hypothetical protein